jgi:hypothetical protein
MGTLLGSWSTSWGYDSEWNLTATLYDDSIHWCVDLDPQWTSPAPQEAHQSLSEFESRGPPGFVAHTGFFYRVEGDLRNAIALHRREGRLQEAPNGEDWFWIAYRTPIATSETHNAGGTEKGWYLTETEFCEYTKSGYWSEAGTSRRLTPLKSNQHVDPPTVRDPETAMQVVMRGLRRLKSWGRDRPGPAISGADGLKGRVGQERGAAWAALGNDRRTLEFGAPDRSSPIVRALPAAAAGMLACQNAFFVTLGDAGFQVFDSNAALIDRHERYDFLAVPIRRFLGGLTRRGDAVFLEFMVCNTYVLRYEIGRGFTGKKRSP